LFEHGCLSRKYRDLPPAIAAIRGLASVEALDDPALSWRSYMAKSTSSRNTTNQPTKAQAVEKLLRSAKGASIAEIAGATG